MAEQKFITDIRVTYVRAPPSDEYKRCGKVPNPAYIWVSTGPAPSVTDIQVLYGDEPTPAGYEKIPQDLNKNVAGKNVYLAFARGGGKSPLLDVCVVSTTSPAPERFVQVQRSLTHETHKGEDFMLFFKTEESAKTATTWKVGDGVDVKDTVEKWCRGRIVGMEGGKVFIHYVGWGDKWNEWLSVNDKRLAPFKTYTKGLDTGPEQNQEAQILAGEELEEFRAFVSKYRVVQDTARWSAEDIEFLITEGSKYVRRILNSVIDDQKVIPEANAFLQCVLRVIVRAIRSPQPLDTAHMANLMLIFEAVGSAAQRRFYVKYGFEKDYKKSQGKFARNLKGKNDSPLKSNFLISNINYFGECDGFESLSARIRNTEVETSFQAIKMFIEALGNIQKTLTAEFSRQFSEQVHEAVFHRCINITDAELKLLSKDSLSFIVQVFEEMMLVGGVKRPVVKQRVEETLLAICLRLLHSSILEKRINGLNQLADTIAVVKRTDEPHAGYRRQQRRIVPMEWLDTGLLLKWLEENKVVELLLGKGAHHAILQKSPLVLRFLAQNDRLEEGHLDLLWKHSLGQHTHETMVRVVYDSIAELARSLSPRHIDELWQRIAALPEEEFNEVFLQFLKTFTSNTVRKNVRASKDEKARTHGLETFWRIIQDNSPVAADLAQIAHGMLVELLASPEFGSFKAFYVDRCMICLRDGKSVPQALELCKAIAKTFPEERRRERSEILGMWETSFQLKALLAADVARYMAAARKAKGEMPALARQASTQVSEAEQRVLVGRHPHAEALKIRLDFLKFLLSCSRLSLDQNQFAVLWRAFVTQHVYPEDTQQFLEWLNNAAQPERRHRFHVFDSKTTDFIFQTFLCSPKELDFVHMTVGAFKCFRSYFLFVYQNANCLDYSEKRNEPKLHTVYDLKGMELGLNALWTMTVMLENAEVGEMVTRFSVEVYTRFEGPAEETHSAFIDRALGLLSPLEETVKAGNGDLEANTRAICQLLDVVVTFFHKLERGQYDKYADEDGYYYNYADISLNVSIHRGGRVVERDLTISPSRLIGQMRSKVAQELKVAPSRIEIQHNRTKLSQEYDNRTCYEVGIRTGDNVDVIVLRAATGKSPSDYARRYLCNHERHFDDLFDLLRLGGRIGAKVWSLLTSLPTNKRLKRQVEEFQLRTAENKPDWKGLFDPCTVLKLLYLLKIVDARIADSHETKEGEKHPDPEDVEDTGDGYCKVLLEEGGFEHLFKAMMGLDLDMVFANELPRECLSMLLHVLHHFMNKHVRQSDVVSRVVQLPQLLNRLWDVLNRAIHVATADEVAEKEEEEEEEDEEENEYGKLGGLVHNTLDSLCACLRLQPTLLTELFARRTDERGFNDIVFGGLLDGRDRGLRSALAGGLQELVRLFESGQCKVPDGCTAPRGALLKGAVKVLNLVQDDSTTCRAYFSLVRFLLADGCGKGYFDEESFALTLADKIKQHPMLEWRGDHDHDFMLAGLMEVTTALLSGVPELKEVLGVKNGLIAEVFNVCLFDIPSPENRDSEPPPKCKNEATRAAAFGLLLELGRGCIPNHRLLLELQTKNHFLGTIARTPKRMMWEFDMSLTDKSELGYVGLKNPGCICYMNSLMQQLFMLPNLRRSLLQVPPDPEEERTESFFYQLQHLLAFLQESEKGFFSARAFCHAFKNWDGGPTNIHVQMDTQEFLNMLFDRIDTKLKNTPYEKTLQQHLGGVFSNEFICKDCPHYKEREEPFYAVSVVVKNKKTLKESLDAFVQGEMLAGENAYMCSGCNKKVDTLKRVCLKKLPPTIIFHLKRFEFDYDTMQKGKVNTRLEFPRKINLKEYTKDHLSKGLENRIRIVDKPAGGSEEAKGEGKETEAKEEQHPPEYYEYELSGVVVHTGSAESGHYYSFCKERDTHSKSWVELNDTMVRPFDPADLDDECFGGEGEPGRAPPAASRMPGFGSSANVVAGPSTGADAMMAMRKYRNAYLLLYDRVRPKLETVESAPALSLPGAVKAVQASQRLEKKRVRVEVPSPIFKNIWDENFAFFHEKHIFERSYFDFTLKVVKQGMAEEKEEEKKVVAFEMPALEDVKHRCTELATRFVFDVVCRSSSKKKLDRRAWADFMKGVFAKSLPSSLWLITLLADNPTWTEDVLMDLYTENFRLKMGGVIREALQWVTKNQLDSIPSVEETILLSGERKRLAGLEEAKRSEDDLAMLKRLEDWDAAKPVCVRLVDMLVNLLVKLPNHWKTFDQYFRVLAGFAQVDGRCAAYLLASSHFLARLIDFYLGEDSPNKSISEIPVTRKGKRRAMTDMYGNVPCFSSLTELVCSLVVICRTGSPSPPPSLAAGVQFTLDDIDRDMLLSKPFLSRLMTEAVGRRTGQWVATTILHWCWENTEMSEHVVGYATQGVEEQPFERIRPYFRVIQPLAALADSLQTKRINWILSSLMSVMVENQKYWSVTELCIEHVLRLAKRNSLCAAWLSAHPRRVEWAKKYVDAYPNRDTVLRYHANLQLFKPSKAERWDKRDTPEPLQSLPPKRKSAALQALLQKKELDADGASDSDEDLNERFFRLNMWVDAQDKQSHWYRGQVVKIDGDVVRVHFDGWESRWDEDYDRWDPKIARYGTYTRRTARKQRGAGPQPGADIY